MEYSIEELIEKLYEKLRICAATNTHMVHIDEIAASEIKTYLENFNEILKGASDG